jgi:acyl-CoA dehydrogenase
MQGLTIPPGALPPEAEALRAEVRAFLAAEMPAIPPLKRCRNWSGADADFSRKMGERGWLGMTWPKAYGGHERSALERYVVLEEMLCAGAPVGAHWVAERQSGPQLMRFAPTTLAPKIVPRIARGEVFFCIGMSEPDSGSDLASIRTKATRSHKDGKGDGWVINGRKLWTSGAHRAHYMIALVRTGEKSENRHGGMSQFLVDMTTPGLTVRPIVNQLGEHDFNEVTFDDVWVPAENLIGGEGDGWAQVGAELAYERSGPERYLSSSQLLLEMLDAGRPRRCPPGRGHRPRRGAATARLRQMSAGRGQHARARREPGPGRQPGQGPGRPGRTGHARHRPRAVRRPGGARLHARPGHALHHAGRALVLPARRHARDPARHHRQGTGL